jgi:hypothetical protein
MVFHLIGTGIYFLKCNVSPDTTIDMLKSVLEEVRGNTIPRTQTKGQVEVKIATDTAAKIMANNATGAGGTETVTATAWNKNTTYKKNTLVTVTNNKTGVVTTYISLAASNSNNDPTASGSKWWAVVTTS